MAVLPVSNTQERREDSRELRRRERGSRSPSGFLAFQLRAAQGYLAITACCGVQLFYKFLVDLYGRREDISEGEKEVAEFPPSHISVGAAHRLAITAYLLNTTAYWNC